MRRRWHFPLWALDTFLGVFAAGSFLHEWTIWRHPLINSRYGWQAADTNLWQAIADPSASWRWDDPNPFCTAVLLLIAIGVGLLVYWIGMGRRQPPEAADYKDAPGGAVADGRVGPTPKAPRRGASN
jgi:hypothetical protein